MGVPHMGRSMASLLTIAALLAGAAARLCAASACPAPLHPLRPPTPSVPVGNAVQVSHGASVTETPPLVGVRNATQRSSDSTHAR